MKTQRTIAGITYELVNQPKPKGDEQITCCTGCEAHLLCKQLHECADSDNLHKIWIRVGTEHVLSKLPSQ